jgi:hypothetical protein
MSREKHADISLTIEQLRDVFKQQIKSSNKIAVNNFVDAIIDSLHEDDIDKLNLFARCLLGVKEISKINLDDVYYIDINDLKTWTFDLQETLDADLTTKVKTKDCLKVKSVTFHPYYHPQYRIIVDVKQNGKIIEHVHRAYQHQLICEEFEFPI